MDDIISVFKALSDEKRYSIVRLLLSGDYCVRALANDLQISESAVSQHIKLLKQTGIVTGERKGYFIHYRVNADVLKDAGVKIISLAQTPRQKCSIQNCGKNKTKGE